TRRRDTGAAGSRSTRSCHWARRALAASVSTNGSAAHRQQPENMRSLFRRFRRNGVAMSILHILGTALVLAFGLQLIQSARAAESAVVTPLMLKELADIPGKEMLMIAVDYPPGAEDPVHRHDAHAFIYVLQGSIVMQVRGGKEVTLVPGQTFYEGPNDVHTVGRNASTTEPAKFIVILLKKQGTDVVLPAE